MKSVFFIVVIFAPFVHGILKRNLALGELFKGFKFILAGNCSTQPDGCFEFTDGWYMYEGKAGTSTCRTTCIPYPGVRPDLKCGRCDDYVASTSVETIVPFTVTTTSPVSPAPVSIDQVSTEPAIAPLAVRTISATLTESPSKSPISSVLPTTEDGSLDASISALKTTVPTSLNPPTYAALRNSPIHTATPVMNDGPGAELGIPGDVVSDVPSSAP